LHRLDDVTAIDEQIGDIHDARGTTNPAVDSYQRALAGAAGPEARAVLKAKIGKTYCAVGDPRGLPYLEEALAELDPATQTNALALATAQMGRYFHYRTEHTKAIEFLHRARQLAEPLDDPETLSDVYTFIAGAHQHLLQYDESDRWSRVAIAYAERKKFPDAIASGYEFLGENAAGRGHWDEALSYGARDYEEGTKSGSLARAAWSQFCLAQGHHGKGELAAARAIALAGLALCDQIGEYRLATWLLPISSIIAADQGDDDAARALAERGWEHAQKLNQVVLSAWALNALGYAAMQRGDLRGALAWYEQYVPLVRDTENGVSRVLILGCAADAFFRACRMDEATALVAQAIAVAEFANAPHRLALARRVHAQILVAQRDFAGALRAFDDAIATFTRLGSGLELARARFHRAALRLAHGDANDHEAARADAGRARDAFAEMGAVHDRVLAEQLMRK
jgi:tetratricopeptide (TPR) repeat protein